MLISRYAKIWSAFPHRGGTHLKKIPAPKKISHAAEMLLPLNERQTIEFGESSVPLHLCG
jgi:hypothetical protein